MKWLVAPNAFKGSLTASEAAAAISRGIHSALPDVQIIEVPLADGGDGTAEVLLRALGGRLVTATVEDPLGRPISATYALVEDGKTAVIEMAAAAGLTLLTPDERNPLITSTYGVGQLIAHAVGMCVNEIIVGIGGSATNDGGAGAMQALGVRFLDSDGKELGRGGAELLRLSHIDTNHMRFPLGEVRLIVASDVTNPLTGPEGASAMYGPQKGASAGDVELLDSALRRYASIIREQLGIDVERIPGSGAAGGLGAGLAAVLHGDIQPGIEVVMQAVRFDELLGGTNVVVTGEGKLDAQTSQGKVIAGVVRHARKFKIPVVAMVGRTEITTEQATALGLTRVVRIATTDITVEEAMARAAELLEAAARRWAMEFSA